MANNPTAAGLRRLLPALLLLGWFFAAGTARAWAQPPMLERRVTDLTDTLSAGQQAVLEARLAEFERQKGSQIAVLLVRTTQPEDIAQFSIRVVEQWKLGRKGVDDGILILVAKDDHKARIEVGYGLEGVVPDAVAKRVIEEIMLPKFRQGDFAGGLNSGVDSLIGLIQGEPLPAAPAFKPGHFFPLLFLLAVFSGSWFRSLFGALFGNLASAGLLGGIIWLLGGGLTWALFGFFFLFIFNMLSGQNHRGGGGYTIGGGGSGGGFSGGGGGFGGGGASGGW